VEDFRVNNGAVGFSPQTRHVSTRRSCTAHCHTRIETWIGSGPCSAGSAPPTAAATSLSLALDRSSHHLGLDLGENGFASLPGSGREDPSVTSSARSDFRRLYGRSLRTSHRAHLDGAGLRPFYRAAGWSSCPLAGLLCDQLMSRFGRKPGIRITAIASLACSAGLLLPV